MFFQIVCESDNPYIHLLKQRRFYVEKADTAYTFFRKVWNRDDDFLSKAYISLEGWITEKGNPKLFKQYLKLELKMSLRVSFLFVGRHAGCHCFYVGKPALCGICLFRGFRGLA